MRVELHVRRHDGVAWAYMVEDGKATVGGGAYDYAIPLSTAGDLAIPSDRRSRRTHSSRFSSLGSRRAWTIFVTLEGSVTAVMSVQFLKAEVEISFNVFPLILDGISNAPVGFGLMAAAASDLNRLTEPSLFSS